MIRFQKITLTDFRVFKGTQTIELPESDGVVVVYGENGKGKTSLLNALRWAFTGNYTPRNGGAPGTHDPALLVNSEAKSERSDAGCKVQVEFLSDGVPHELTRKVQWEGQSYRETCILRRGSTVFNQADGNRLLEQLLPPEVQQFFFFDAELLGQFEGLLSGDDYSADKLSKAIERLLGVPVVLNASQDSQWVASDATNRIAEAAKKDRDSADLGNQLNTANDLLQQCVNSLDEELKRTIDLETELEQLDAQLEANKKKTDLMAAKKALRSGISDLADKCAAARVRLAEALNGGWLALLEGTVSRQLAEAELNHESLLTSRNETAVAVWLSERIGEGPPHDCPACGAHPLAPEQVAILEKLRAQAHELGGRDESVEDSSRRIKLLRNCQKPVAAERVKTAESSYHGHRVELDDKVQELQELDAQINDPGGEVALQELIRQKTQKQIALARSSEVLKVLTEEEKDRRSKVSGFTAKIGQMAPSSLPANVSSARDTATDLGELFKEAVERYRTKLRNDIQAEATKLFVKMRSEPDFIGLAINERYGLSIIDSEGEIVHDRSAGYEHLVALALIGGLQACSTIAGPVVMDSPFGRLDPLHVEQVTANISDLADQVILLAHEGEIDPSSASGLLKGALQAEFQMVRITSTHTEIQRKETR